MSQEFAGHAATEEGSVWLRPWRVLLMGLAAVVVGAALVQFDGPVITPIRLLLMFAGLIAGAWAVKQRLSTADDELDERIESAGLVAVYSFCGLVGYLGMAETWFSGRIFFGFFITASIIGSLLVLLPRVVRRLAAIVLIGLHFFGIVIASTSSAVPPSGQVPYLPSLLWTQVYRPYLTGLYLTNAYHFYAPEPGSSTLVWMRMEYDDGSYRWLKFPNRAISETPLHYQRQMGLCEATSSRAPPLPPAVFQKLVDRRRFAGALNNIPLRDDMIEYAQYSPPQEYSQLVMESMARHVCRYYPNPKDGKPAIRVKIYRLSYTIVPPEDLLKGRDPLDDKLKAPFFMGEYDNEGRLLQYDSNNKPVPPETPEATESPFLYWAIPMEYLPLHSGDQQVQKREQENGQ